jgi:transposase
MVDTTRVKQLGIGRHGRKNDRIDTEALAVALYEDRIPLAHILSPDRQELRFQLSVRRALVETRAQYVALVVGAAYVSVIDQASRFRNAHQVVSYLGLVPSERSSGQRRRLGAISKMGNTYLRALLVEAEWCLLRGKDGNPLTVWGRAVAQRRGDRIAAVAVARRLAGILWAIWRDGTVFDPERVARTSAAGLNQRAALTQWQAERMAVAI